MTDIEKLLSKVSEAARRLNESSDAINKILNHAEERRRVDNIGLEFIDYDAPLASMPADTEETNRVCYLGFAKEQSQWGLVVEQTREWTDDDEELQRKVEGRHLLSQESREIRVAALKRLPAFLERFESVIADTADRVGNALKTL